MSGSWRKAKLERHHDGTGGCDLGGIESHGQSTNMPQNCHKMDRCIQMPHHATSLHHATCLKYDTLIVIGEYSTCFNQFHTVLSQIAFSGHDRSTKQRWQGVGSSAHKIQKNEVVNSMKMKWMKWTSCHHPVNLVLWCFGGLWSDPHSRRPDWVPRSCSSIHETCNSDFGWNYVLVTMQVC